jgi:Flp pilus assembly protein TadD
MKPGKKKQTKKEKFQKSREEATLKKSEITSQKFNYLPYLIIVFLGLGLYVNTIGHEYALDDYSIILENTVTRQGISAIPEIFSTPYRYGYYSGQGELYRPIPKAMFAIEWDFFPENPLPGHLFNILLYCLSAVLLYRLLLKFTGNNIYFSFFTTLLFIAHPIHTEVVANIKSRDEILSFLFSIWAIDQFYKFLFSKKVKDLSLSLIIFMVGLLSKESTITMLAVFPLVGWTFGKLSIKDTLLKTVPYIGVAVVYLLIRNGVIDSQEPSSVSIADNLLMAAGSVSERIATTVVIMGIYLKLLIIPHPLAFDYSFNQIPIVGLSSIWFIISLITYISIIVIAIVLIRKKHLIGFALLFFLVTFSIYSNLIITIGSSLGERFLYTPSLGFCIAIGFLLTSGIIFKPLHSSSGESFKIQFKHPAWLILVVIVGLYSVKTINRNRVWMNNKTLYSNDVLISSNSTRTHYYMGNLLVKPESWGDGSEQSKAKAINKALTYLDKSIEIYPEFADAHLQKGVALYYLKRFEDALSSYQEALKINPTNPTTNNNIGTIYFENQEYQQALTYFLNAIKYNPTYAEAYANAGSIYGITQQYDDAIRMFNQAIKNDPTYAQAYYFLGITYRNKGDEGQAQVFLQKAAQLNPDYASALQ